MAGDHWYGCSRMQNAWTTLSLVILLALKIPSSNASVISHIEPRSPIANGIPLRVLPIGDSITFGAPIDPYNGYRAELREMLVNRSNTVDYVGSTRSGTFIDNQHEGHRGKIIDEIAEMSDVGIYAAPNVVLVHAGTNDINRNIDCANAPARLSKLIGYIYDHSPDAAVFVAQIIPSKTQSTFDRVKTFNKAIPNVVNEWIKKGKHVTIVNMFDAVDKDDDLYDSLHPNYQGYTKMAHKWYDAINEADTKGWITKAGEMKIAPGSATQAGTCDLPPSWKNLGEIATGPHAAYNDAPFQQKWDKVGVFSKRACEPSRLFFADLDGDGYKDWACVGENDGQVLAFLQKPIEGRPSNNWESLGIVATGRSGRNSSGVFFADLNGDGRDDYIYVDGGNVHTWINGGQSGGTWVWNYIGIVNGNDVGATRENLQMVDIDGDGRADFLIVNSKTGEVTAWLNGGPHTLPEWYKIGVIATGASKTVNDIVILGDFTGNGKADYMLVGKSGKVTGIPNFIQERGFVPYWGPKVTVAEGPAGAQQEYVRLVDMNGDGKADYVLLDKNGGSQLWINTGTGGKWQVGDGVFLCDLDGDGTKDYLWLDGWANAWGYLNTGHGRNEWNGQGQIRVSQSPVDLRYVRWAPITKTGRADMIVLDQEQGACLWSQNLGSQGSAGYSWGDFGVLATGPRHSVVAAPYNWKWDSRRVQFADLTGDGLADYLYVNTNGAVLMWKNMGTSPPSWGPPQLVAAGPSKGVWWTEIQFADVDGDGRTDYIHIDRLTGRTEVWRHNGFYADNSINWSPPVSFAAGPGPAGFNIRIADMTGDGLSDYVSVDPRTGGLTLWQNICRPLPSTTAPTSPTTTSSGSSSPETDDPNAPEIMPVDPDVIGPCDHDTYASIDDIQSDAANIPAYCMNQYILATQSKILSDTLKQYSDIMANGYDDKYNTYNQYIHEIVPAQIEDFIAANGDKYFTCTVEENKNCCGDCGFSVSVCRSCDPSCDKSGWQNVTADHCPTQTVPGVVNYPYRTTWWNLNDHDGFLNDLSNTAGIDPSWVVFGTQGMGLGPACHGSDCSDINWYGFPITPNFQVPNPKDIIGSGLSNYNTFSDVLSDAAQNVATFLYGGDSSDVIDSASLPVAMLPVAVSSMSSIASTADKIDNAKKKEIIMAFLMGFLLVLPGLGELAEAADLATLARLISLAGDAGDTALSIYSEVSDPHSSFMDIFGIILGGLKVADEVADEAAFLSAGALRRSMTDADIGKLPDDAKTTLGKISGVKNSCI